MIALFPTLKAAQAYCDACDAELGLPKMGKHPRTGEPRVEIATWDTPKPHPDGSGRAWCEVHPEYASPDDCVLEKDLPDEWREPGPLKKIEVMTRDECVAAMTKESDPGMRAVMAAHVTKLDTEVSEWLKSQK